VDRLDKISAVAIVGLLIWALVLVVVQSGQRDERREGAGQQAVLRVDPVLDQKIALAKTLLGDNNVEQADKLLTELIATYPFEAMPYLLKGDLALYRQDAVAAMLQYRTAVDLNPDFLDKKSGLFQGKKIKKTVEEAQGLIESGLHAKPAAAELREARKVYYYMLRKIAGSCG
jgi:predicted Zn-dependent protease